MAIALFSYVGVETAAVAAAKVRDHECKVPRATVFGALAAAAVYLLSLTAVFGKIPTGELAESNVPYSDAADVVIAADTDAVYVDWNTPRQRPIQAAHTDELGHLSFAAGSMGPKVEAAADFAGTTGKDAVIGALADLPLILDGWPAPGCR
jgi:amino acid transporter